MRNKFAQLSLDPRPKNLQELSNNIREIANGMNTHFSREAREEGSGILDLREWQMIVQALSNYAKILEGLNDDLSDMADDLKDFTG